MKEQFVPHEIALKLKEKGFDEPCLGYFDPLYKKLVIWENGSTNSTSNWVYAPLWQQVIDWLEREHWVDFWAVPILTPNPKQYECFIMYRGKEISCDILGIRFFNSYNDARQTAVEKILKHI
jgi:hypothetical protein